MKLKRLSDEKVQKINQVKRLLDKISTQSASDAKSELESLETQLSEIKGLIIYPTRREDIESTIPEHAISLFVGTFTQFIPEYTGLLRALDIIFTKAPEVLKPSEKRKPLLHHAIHTPVYVSKGVNAMEELFALFFKHGADFNIRDRVLNYTAHVVVTRGNFLLFPALIRFGCGINRIDAVGKSPLDLVGQRQDKSPNAFVSDLGGLKASVIRGGMQLLISEQGDFFNKFRLRQAQAVLEKIDLTDDKLKQDVGRTMEYMLASQGTEEQCELAWLRPSNFNPNTLDSFGNHIGSVAITHPNPAAAILNLKRYFLHGLDFSLRNRDGENLFDMLARQKKLSVFLADYFIRAILLSGDRFDHEYIRSILLKEQQELQEQQAREESRLQQEQKLEADRYQRAREAVIAKRKGESAENKAINYVVSILKVCKTPENLAVQIAKNTFLKNISIITKQGWVSVKNKLKETLEGITDSDHRFVYIADQIRSLLDKSSVQALIARKQSMAPAENKAIGYVFGILQSCDSKEELNTKTAQKLFIDNSAKIATKEDWQLVKDKLKELGLADLDPRIVYVDNQMQVRHQDLTLVESSAPAP